MAKKLSAIVFVVALGLAAFAGWKAWDMGKTDTWQTAVFAPLMPLLLFAMIALRIPSKIPPLGWAVGGGLLAVWVAWLAAGMLSPPWTTLDLTTKSEPEPTCLMRFMDGDRELGTLNWPTETRVKFRGKYDEATFKIEMFGPNGWVKRDFVFGDGPKLQICPVDHLFIDNRTPAAAKIEVGELQFEVAANSAVARPIVRGNGKEVGIRINGNEIGKSSLGGSFLIDVTGKRRYSLRTIEYGKGGAIEPKDAQPRDYLEKHVHELAARPDYFLQPAPPSVTVSLSPEEKHQGVSVVKYELGEK